MSNTELKERIEKLYKPPKTDILTRWSPLIVFIAFICVLVIAMSDGQISNLPVDAIPSYRTIENTGGLFGCRAEYYIFDTEGHRYKVTQKLYDTYIELPKDNF
jgi:hypothetical protein